MMKRAWQRGLVPLLWGALVVFTWSQPLPAAIVQPSVRESGSVIVTAETAEVREGPSPGANVITVVAKGEIFLKQGRTGAWYYIQINADTFGWIRGRAVGRYEQAEAETSPPPPLGPYESSASWYYSGIFGVYPFYSWYQPSVFWDGYYYDREPYRGRSWDYDRHYHRDRDRDRARHDGWRRSDPPSRPHVPRLRGPFQRR